VRPKNAIVMLVRYPRLGEVKTRIGSVLGDETARDLHDRLARHTLRTALDLQSRKEARVHVRCDAAFVGAAKEWLGPGPRYRYQGDGDLGVKIALAFAETFGGGASKVIVIGSDCAALEPRHLSGAFAALDSSDCVIGPAVDGGYYLIGLTREAGFKAGSLFTDMPWGSPDILSQTRHAAQNAGLTTALLEELADVDTPEDIPAAEAILSASPASSITGVSRPGWLERLKRVGK